MRGYAVGCLERRSADFRDCQDLLFGEVANQLAVQHLLPRTRRLRVAADNLSVLRIDISTARWLLWSRRVDGIVVQAVDLKPAKISGMDDCEDNVVIRWKRQLGVKIAFFWKIKLPI